MIKLHSILFLTILPVYIFSQSIEFRNIDTLFHSLNELCTFDEIEHRADSIELAANPDEPTSGLISYWRGRAHYETAQFDLAESAFQKSAKIFIDHGQRYLDCWVRSRTYQAKMAYDFGSVETSKAILKEILSTPKINIQNRVEVSVILTYQYFEIRKFATADSILRRVNNLVGTIIDSFSVEAGKIFLQKANLLYGRNKMSKGLVYANLAHDIFSKRPNANTYELMYSKESMGTGLTLVDFKKSILMKEDALNIGQCNGFAFNLRKAVIHYNIADAQKIKGHHRLAEMHYLRSVEILDEVGQNEHLRQWKNYIYLAETYANLKDTLNTKMWADKSLSLANKIGLLKSSRMTVIYSALFNVARDLNKKLEYQLMINEYLKLPLFSDWSRMNSLRTLSSLHAKLGQMEKSLEYFNASNNLEGITRAHSMVPDLYKESLDLAMHQKDFEKAELMVDSSFQQIKTLGNGLDQLYQKIDRSPDLYHKSGLIFLHKWKDGKDTSALIDAQSSFLSAIQAIEFLLPIVHTMRERNNLTQKMAKYYAAAVSNAIEIRETISPEKWDEILYGLVNKSKNVVTRISFNELQGNAYRHIPDSVRQIWYGWNRSIILLQRELLKENDPHSIQKISVEIEEIKKQLNTSKYNTSPFVETGDQQNLQQTANSLSKTQNQLPDSTCLLEFFISKNRLFVFFAGRSDYELIELGDYHQIRQNILLMIPVLRYQDPNANFDLLFSLAQNLFDQILKIPLNRIQQDKSLKHLILILDRELNYLPFEILSQDGKSFMIESEFTFSYALSNAIFNKSLDSQSKMQVAYFEPDYSNQTVRYTDTVKSEMLASLVRTNSLTLPTNLSSPMKFWPKGAYHEFKGPKATKEYFLSHLNEFNIIHLSMHALIDEAYPVHSMLLFQNQPNEIPDEEKLFLGEIYQQPIGSELIVLDACQTGTGEIYSGEGVVSFARAFQGAGAHSTISGLWNLPHQATSKITSAFYEHLSIGESKSRALKNAKLDYLNAINEPALKHPYYWAGLVLHGKIDPIALEIPINNSFLFLILAIGLVIFGCLFWYFRKRIIT